MFSKAFFGLSVKDIKMKVMSYKSLTYQLTEMKLSSKRLISGVRGREVNRWPRNHKVLSSIPGGGCQL